MINLHLNFCLSILLYYPGDEPPLTDAEFGHAVKSILTIVIVVFFIRALLSSRSDKSDKDKNDKK
jgi:hypothetical protein